MNFKLILEVRTILESNCLELINNIRNRGKNYGEKNVKVIDYEIIKEDVSEFYTDVHDFRVEIKMTAPAKKNIMDTAMRAIENKEVISYEINEI